MQITIIGLDLAKHWFQVHGVDADGHVVVRRRLWRSGVIPYFRSLEPELRGAHRKVGFRRISPVAKRSGEGRLTEPKAGARSRRRGLLTAGNGRG